MRIVSSVEVTFSIEEQSLFSIKGYVIFISPHDPCQVAKILLLGKYSLSELK